MTTGIGELTFPDEETIHLKPLLLTKREKLQSTRPLWSLLIPIPSIFLWCLGLGLLLYPLNVILLSKYRHDFQDDWRNHLMLLEVEETSAGLLYNMVVVARSVTIHLLDYMTIWILDSSPRVAAAMLLFHIGLCLAYVSRTAFQENRILKQQQPVKTTTEDHAKQD